MLLLDSGIMGYLLNENHPWHEMIKNNLLQQKPENIALSAITGSELYLSANKSGSNKLNSLIEQIINHFVLLDLTEKEIAIYGKIRAHLIAENADLGSFDTMIAATAIANRCTLVTHQTRSFDIINKLKIAKLKLVDWIE